LVSVTDGSFEDNRISKLNRQILSAIAEYQREAYRFQSIGQQGEKETTEQKGKLCYFRGQG